MAGNEARQSAADGYAGSVLDNLAREIGYHHCLGQMSRLLKKNGTTCHTVDYDYDAASRLAGGTIGN